MREIKQGNIITRNWGNFPVYGIALPKGKFLEYFQKEKGKWPEGELYSEKMKKTFGFELPSQELYSDFEIDGNDEMKKIQSAGTFVANKQLVGAKMFGDFYDNFSKRELGFEILPEQNISGVYRPKDLEIILATRRNCICEFGEPSSITPSPHYELIWLQEYFSGKYNGKTTESIRDELSFEQKQLIDLLRDCEIPEGIL